MRFNPFPLQTIAPNKRRRDHRDRDALEQDLRQPVPQTDEAFCEQIMDTVRQADRPSGPVDVVQSRPWMLSWAGASTALGAAAVVAVLVWTPPQSGVTEPMSSEITAASLESDLLASDTRQIAAFLRDNLRL